MIKRIGILFVAALASAETTMVVVGKVGTEVLEARLSNAPRKNLDRQAAMASLFRASGCDAEHLEERRIKHSKQSNVLCTVPGTGPGMIVVGAHFDHVSAGDGVVDNWSGASLLPLLSASLRIQPRKHTFLYAAFGEEETGLTGSKELAKSLDAASVQAMVNIDSVGVGPTAIWEIKADKQLRNYAFGTARSLGLELGGVNIGNVGDTDSTSFQNRKIAVVDFHSIHQDALRILHSPADVFAAIRLNDYADTFRIVSNYLGYIDQMLP
jgi:hypothetical protein